MPPHNPLEIDLTVITATCRRHAQLASCLSQFRNQSLGDLRCEHLVVSDGIDPEARWLVGKFGARYVERPEPGGQWGSLARDLGICEARGLYVCFWDDDNLYEPHALAALYGTAFGHDIGVVQTRYRCRSRAGQIVIPRRWTGSFRPGDVDTMCVCVRRELASREPWEQLPDPSRPTTDWNWLHRLEKYQPRIQFVPMVVGFHL